MASIRWFVIVVRDDDTMTFDIVKTANDNPLNERVVAAQNQGRRVNCFSVEKEAAAIEEMLRRGYARKNIPLP